MNNQRSRSSSGTRRRPGSSSQRQPTTRRRAAEKQRPPRGGGSRSRSRGGASARSSTSRTRGQSPYSVRSVHSACSSSSLNSSGRNNVALNSATMRSSARNSGVAAAPSIRIRRPSRSGGGQGVHPPPSRRGRSATPKGGRLGGQQSRRGASATPTTAVSSTGGSMFTGRKGDRGAKSSGGIKARLRSLSRGFLQKSEANKDSKGRKKKSDPSPIDQSRQLPALQGSVNRSGRMRGVGTTTGRPKTKRGKSMPSRLGMRRGRASLSSSKNSNLGRSEHTLFPPDEDGNRSSAGPSFLDQVLGEGKLRRGFSKKSVQKMKETQEHRRGRSESFSSGHKNREELLRNSMFTSERDLLLNADLEDSGDYQYTKPLHNNSERQFTAPNPNLGEGYSDPNINSMWYNSERQFTAPNPNLGEGYSDPNLGRGFYDSYQSAKYEENFRGDKNQRRQSRSRSKHRTDNAVKYPPPPRQSQVRSRSGTRQKMVGKGVNSKNRKRKGSRGEKGHHHRRSHGKQQRGHKKSERRSPREKHHRRHRSEYEDERDRIDCDDDRRRVNDGKQRSKSMPPLGALKRSIYVDRDAEIKEPISPVASVDSSWRYKLIKAGKIRSERRRGKGKARGEQQQVVDDRARETEEHVDRGHGDNNEAGDAAGNRARGWRSQRSGRSRSCKPSLASMDAMALVKYVSNELGESWFVSDDDEDISAEKKDVGTANNMKVSDDDDHVVAPVEKKGKRAQGDEDKKNVAEKRNNEPEIAKKGSRYSSNTGTPSTNASKYSSKYGSGMTFETSSRTWRGHAPDPIKSDYGSTIGGRTLPESPSRSGNDFDKSSESEGNAAEKKVAVDDGNDTNDVDERSTDPNLAKKVSQYSSQTGSPSHGTSKYEIGMTFFSGDETGSGTWHGRAPEPVTSDYGSTIGGTLASAPPKEGDEKSFNEDDVDANNLSPPVLSRGVSPIDDEGSEKSDDESNRDGKSSKSIDPMVLEESGDNIQDDKITDDAKGDDEKSEDSLFKDAPSTATKQGKFAAPPLHSEIRSMKPIPGKSVRKHMTSKGSIEEEGGTHRRTARNTPSGIDVILPINKSNSRRSRTPQPGDSIGDSDDLVSELTLPVALRRVPPQHAHIRKNKPQSSKVRSSTKQRGREKKDHLQDRPEEPEAANASLASSKPGTLTGNEIKLKKYDASNSLSTDRVSALTMPVALHEKFARVFKELEEHDHSEQSIVPPSCRGDKEDKDVRQSLSPPPQASQSRPRPPPRRPPPTPSRVAPPPPPMRPGPMKQSHCFSTADDTGLINEKSAPDHDSSFFTNMADAAAASLHKQQSVMMGSETTLVLKAPRDAGSHGSRKPKDNNNLSDAAMQLSDSAMQLSDAAAQLFAMQNGGGGKSGKSKTGKSLNSTKRRERVKNMPYVDEYDDMGIYTGEVNGRGQPHGSGRIRYDNGVLFEGDWVNGVRDGFESAQRDGLMSGFTSRRSKKLKARSMAWEDLSGQAGRYTGSLNTDGIPHGRGVMRYDYGLVAEGEWVNGNLITNAPENS